LSLASNYRPVSLLPVLSKIFETVIYNRLLKHVTENNLLACSQHGFIKGKSTDSAIYEMSEYILSAFDNQEAVLGTFLDLSKAFDTINHSILLQKLERYGVRGTPLKLLASYLNNRCQKVRINNNGINYTSSTKKISMGVPQGSILGPLLFIIYVNDLASLPHLRNCLIDTYADDTNFLIKGKSMDGMVVQLHDVFNSMLEWFITNKLVLNTEKTQCVAFRSDRSNITVPVNVSLNNCIIPLAKQTKFLGYMSMSI
jgi:hypothetical protein